MCQSEIDALFPAWPGSRELAKQQDFATHRIPWVSFSLFARTWRSRGPNVIQLKDKEMCEYGVCSQRRVTTPRHDFLVGYDAKACLVGEPNQVGFPMLVAAGGI